MIIPNQTSAPIPKVSSIGVKYTQYEVRVPAYNDPALVLVPDTVPSDNKVNVIHALHGRNGSYTYITSREPFSVVERSLGDGFIVVCPNMGGGATWGNQLAMNTINAMFDWIRTFCDPQKHFVMGSSMGATAALNFIRRDYEPIAGCILVAPSFDLQRVWDRNTAGHDGLEAAFGIPSTGVGLQSVVDTWSPFQQPISYYTSTPVIGFSSEGDYVPTPTLTNWSVKLRAAGGKINHLYTSGDHASPDYWRPVEVHRFIQENLAYSQGHLKQWTGYSWVTLRQYGKVYYGK